MVVATGDEAMHETGRRPEEPERPDDGPEQEGHFKCDMCGATFTNREMLEKHKKVHSTAVGSAAAGDVEIGIPPTTPDGDEGPPGWLPEPPPAPN